MILLDTNVLSALMHDPSDPDVVAWADGQGPDELWTTAISVFEIRTWVSLPESCGNRCPRGFRMPRAWLVRSSANARRFLLGPRLRSHKSRRVLCLCAR